MLMHIYISYTCRSLFTTEKNTNLSYIVAQRNAKKHMCCICAAYLDINGYIYDFTCGCTCLFVTVDAGNWW